MISAWENELNNSHIVKTEDSCMTLSSILSSLNVTKNNFVLNNEYSTIRYISENEYEDFVYKYIEPQFYECDSPNVSNPKFILFSAPGATGKTALAMHICKEYNGIYWDLPENKVAEYSFNGAIAEAVGYGNLSNFIMSIENRKNFLVIDAFDEAEVGSGRSGIEFFLRDLNNVTKNCNDICAILLARTESSLFIKKFFSDHNISFKHYEVGLFKEYNAKTYIKCKLEKFKINISGIVNKCIEEQFKEIKRILPENESENFLGYAPVLDALATAYDEEKNTLNLLKNTSDGEKNYLLMIKILAHLLNREQKKFINSIEVKIPNLKDNANLENLFDNDEQLSRLFGLILVSDSTMFAQVKEIIPIEYHEDYLDAINIQLPQHPFIKSKDYANSISYDFIGAAFRDYVIAYCLSNNELSYFVDDYISYNPKYCPSQMLVEFYGNFSNYKLSGKYVYLLYDSFKSYARLGDKISVYINGNNDDCSIEFVLISNNKTTSTEFKLININEGIWINQLSNCYVDVDAKVYIGSFSNESRISNSFINCEEIIWRCERISIEAYFPGECVIYANRFKYFTEFLPKFEIKTDGKNNLKINSSNINDYFKLLAYKYDDSLDQGKDDFSIFANLLRRIFSCLRSHSKDTPARKMDFINNRIINTNKKKQIFNFLLTEHVLYTDQQNWLYKLDTNKLSEFSINWNDVRDGNYNSLNSLFLKFH